MLSCFLCGRSGSVIEPTPPHKFSPSCQETNHCNGVNGDPLSKAHLDASSFGADAKKGDLICKRPESLNNATPLDAAPNDNTSKSAYPSDASDCHTKQKDVVISTIEVKGKHTERHSNCSIQEAKFDEYRADDANLLGSDEKVCNEVREQDLKSSMQYGFSKHEALTAVNELLSCGSQMPDNTAVPHDNVITSKSICTDTSANAKREITSKAICEEDDAGSKKDVNAEKSKSQSFEAHGEMETCGFPSRAIDAGYHTDRGLKSYKPKEPADLFSYGISDQQRDFLFLCAGLVIQAVGFQLKSIAEVITAIILLGYRAYFLASSVFDSLSHIKAWIHATHAKLLSHIVTKDHRRSLALHVEKLENMKPLVIAGAKRMGWGCVTAAYVLAILTALLFISLVFSYFAVLKGSSTQKPIHITKQLYFDYTKSHPVASLNLLPLNVNHKCNASKAVKPNHMASFRYHCIIFLTVPESDYNRNLGVFQVTTELLSDNGDILAKASQPCMLHFKSNTLHYVKSICLAIPLLAGATSESQTLRVTSLEWQETAFLPKYASVLRISLMPRAGHDSSNGLPELYEAEIRVDRDWMSSTASGSSIRALVMWIGLSFLLFGFFSILCVYKIHHQNRTIS